jgi:hypothetical protein
MRMQNNPLPHSITILAQAGGVSRALHHRHAIRHDHVMPDRPFRAVDELIRRVQRVAAGRPNPTFILAQTISLAGTSGVDPYAVLGVLVEGAVQTLTQHIPPERQAEAAATLVELLRERLEAHGLRSDDSKGRRRGSRG